MRASGLILVLLVAFPLPVSAQQMRPASNLEGFWTIVTATPLERIAAFDGPTTTEERAAVFEKAGPDAFIADTSDGVGGRQSEYWEVHAPMIRIGGEIRTSVVVDPPDGKLPYSAAGRALLGGRLAGNTREYDGPEIRPSPERCLTGVAGSTGTPMISARYNGHYQFVQTASHVVIAAEHNEVRIIPVGPFAAPPFPRWMGGSIGHWEGDTLVVETSGFKPGDAFKAPQPVYISANAKVTERFTRVSPTEIVYRFTVEDPDVFTRTWRGEQVFRRTADRMFEYACHEGNYALPNVLAGGRVAERKAGKP